MAIWYRHWLELRYPVLILLTAVIFTVYRFDAGLAEMLARFETTGRFPGAGGRWFQPLTETLPPPDVIALIAHADSMVMLVWGAALLLCGNGFRVNVIFGSGSSSTWSSPVTAIQYTLSLPLSRTTLVLTRLAAGGIVALLTLAFASASNAAVLAWRGLPILPGPMVAIATAALLAALFWIATVGLLTMIFGTGWGLGVSVFGLMITVAFLGPAMGNAAAQQGVLFLLLPLGTVLTGGVIYLSAAVARDEEV